MATFKIGTQVKTKDSMGVLLVGKVADMSKRPNDAVAQHYKKKGWIMIIGMRPDGRSSFEHFADPAKVTKA